MHEGNSNAALKQTAAVTASRNPETHLNRDWTLQMGRELTRTTRVFWTSKPKANYDWPSLTVISLIPNLTVLQEETSEATYFHSSPRPRG